MIPLFILFPLVVLLSIGWADYRTCNGKKQSPSPLAAEALLDILDRAAPIAGEHQVQLCLLTLADGMDSLEQATMKAVRETRKLAIGWRISLTKRRLSV